MLRSSLFRSCTVFLTMLMLSLGLSGCGNSRSPIDEPIRYTTVDKLRERLEDVAKYGDGGSSLGGIPESIDELMQSDPENGKLLQEEFLKLNTADDKETRKEIARRMADHLIKLDNGDDQTE